MVKRSVAGRCAVVAAAGLLALAPVAPASAAPVGAASGDGPRWGDGLDWEPFRTSGFTAPAGQLCDFTLKSEPVQDEEMVATVARFPDGSPRVQAFKGTLVVRYTNVDSGASTEVDLSGKAWVHYQADGAWTMAMYGPVGVGMNADDRYPRGMYVFDGFHVIHNGAGEDRDRRVVADAGTEHNICDDLDG